MNYYETKINGCDDFSSNLVEVVTFLVRGEDVGARRVETGDLVEICSSKSFRSVFRNLKQFCSVIGKVCDEGQSADIYLDQSGCDGRWVFVADCGVVRVRGCSKFDL